MPNLSIKDVPEALAETLRQRAARNHRSLQGELMSILEAAVSVHPLAAEAAVPTRRSPSRKSFQAAAAEFRSRVGASLGASQDSTALIREMRDAHYGEAWVVGGVKDGLPHSGLNGGPEEKH